jgi:alkylation response protein AidB-like acyl-CoA dehydrogenase
LQFALNPDQLLLKESVDKWLQERYGARQSLVYRSTPEGYSRENWRALATLGVLALPFSSDEGGLDGGPKETVTVMESMGRTLAVEPFLEEVILAAGLLGRAGTVQQKAQWLPRVMDGTAHLALAHVEQAARFDVQRVSVRATADPRGARLDGEKSMVPFAGSADLWIVSAQAEKTSRNPTGNRFYLVAPDADGIDRRDFRLVDGTVASVISFRNAPTSGCFPEASEAIDFVFDAARLAAGAQMLGIMSLLYDSTLDYLKNRRQFGAPIASFQAIQHRMADLYVSLEQSRSMVYRAALTFDTPSRRPLGVAAMKSYVSSAAVALGEDCVHLHGAMGMTDELDIGTGLKRLLVLASFLGDCDDDLSRYMRLRRETAGSH